MATSHSGLLTASPVALLVPDFDSEGPAYWQDHWARTRMDCRGTQLGRSTRPDRNDWVTKIDQALRAIDAPVLLVGHGAGALAIAAWAELMSCEGESGVVGALLVGPSDPCREGADQRLQAFTPLPAAIFSFPALVVASDDDPALPLDRAFSLARRWGAGFANFGPCGCFGPSDGLGWWPEGEELLDRFIDLLEPGRDMNALGGMVGIDQLAFAVPSVGTGALFRP